MTIIEKLTLGLTVAAIGIVVVFAILAVLILAIKLMGLIIASFKKAGNENKKSDNLIVQNVEISQKPSDDDRLIAVISGAVAMMLGENCQDNEKPGFVITQIKRIKR